MISHAKGQLVSLLVLCVTCHIALAGEPNDANEPLRFEVSTTVLPCPAPLLDKPADRQPTYAVGIAPQGSVKYFAWPKSFLVRGYRHTAILDKDLSPQQKEFVEDTNGLLDAAERSYTVLYPEGDPNHPQVLLYAMTLPDAKRMAQLHVQFARQEYKRSLDDMQGVLTRRSKQIADDEQRIPVVEERLAAAQKSVQMIRGIILYRSEQEASEAIGELDRVLSTAQIEIAGIRARIEVIQSYQNKKPATAVATQLELMFIEEAVAMRGAEAKREKAMELREKASQFIDLSQSIKALEEEKKTLPENLNYGRESLPDTRQRLATIRESEPKVRNNTAFIYRVGQGPQPRTHKP